MGGWVAYRILVSAPVPFWVYWGWNWVGSGWDWARGDLGLKGWGLGLDNFVDNIVFFTESLKGKMFESVLKRENCLF